MAEMFEALRSKVDDSIVIENVEIFDIRQVTLYHVQVLVAG